MAWLTTILPIAGAVGGWWLAVTLFDSLELGRVVLAAVLAIVGAVSGATISYFALRGAGQRRAVAAWVVGAGALTGLLVAPVLVDILRS